MLGSQVVIDAPAGVTAIGTDLAEGVDAPGVDLSDEKALAALWAAHGPFGGVIHAAAYTAVDRAEEEEELAQRVNALVPEVLARACVAGGIPMVHVSTDFVFDGTRSEPYPADHPTEPLGAYGRTKLEGEQRAQAADPSVRIVRTQWLYGPRGGHFPGTIGRLARERETLRVVSDQIGAPTSTLELAPALWDVWRKGEAGIYHASCEGSASWFDFASRTVEILRRSETLALTDLSPCTTEEYPLPAPRPAYSVLDCERLTRLRGRSLADWKEALDRFMDLEASATGAPQQ